MKMVLVEGGVLFVLLEKLVKENLDLFLFKYNFKICLYMVFIKLLELVEVVIVI